MASAKTDVIERLFLKRWDSTTATLSNSVVTLTELSDEIRRHNQLHPAQHLSDRNPANFFKDFIRKKRTANQNWPSVALVNGYTGRQLTGGNVSFEFVKLASGQSEPFSVDQIPPPTENTPSYQIESVSLPLASRRLGRGDEPWLTQVSVRLHVIETHLSLVSQLNVVQVDHLQMSVKLRRSEIDALYLGIEEATPGAFREIIICCEAKGRSDDILEDQVLSQARAVFGLRGVQQNIVVPMAIKAIGPSKIHVVEFDVVRRDDAATTTSLTIASDAVYEFVPPVPGVGV